MLLTFLRVSVSLIFFTNKVLVLIGKKSGWLIGAIAGILAMAYFVILGLKVYVVMEFGVFILMLYGFLVGKKKNPRTELAINAFIIIMLGVFAYFVFSGLLTIVEFVSSVAFLIGTYHLTHEKIRLGWFLYVVAHIGSTYLGVAKEENFFAIFQVASAIVASVGFVYPTRE